MAELPRPSYDQLFERLATAEAYASTALAAADRIRVANRDNHSFDGASRTAFATGAEQLEEALGLLKQASSAFIAAEQGQ
jgi:hypothetical protein